MNDLLTKWIDLRRSALEEAGFRINFRGRHVGGSIGVDLDSDNVVGTITHWPKERFEFQFNSCETSEVLLLEERDLGTVEEIDGFFEEIRRRYLSHM